MGANSERPADRVPLRQAAARLGIPRGWAMRLCREGRLPVRTELVGSTWYVERRGLERLTRALHGDGPGDRPRGRRRAS